VPQKELQPAAFSVMPLVWSIGSIFGPILGGALASPAKRYPKLFGQNEFLNRFPFALPNMVAAVIFCIGITTGVLFLKVSIFLARVAIMRYLTYIHQETLESKKHGQKDYGLMVGSFLKGSFKRKSKSEWPDRHEQASPLLKEATTASNQPVARGTYREVFSPQSTYNLIVYALISLHAVSFDQVFEILQTVHGSYYLS